jgi:hypothetical protein
MGVGWRGPFIGSFCGGIMRWALFKCFFVWTKKIVELSSTTPSRSFVPVPEHAVRPFVALSLVFESVFILGHNGLCSFSLRSQ